MFAQPELERVLDERVRGLAAVTVARGSEVVDADGASDGARLGCVARRAAHVTKRSRATWSAATAPTASSARTLGATVTDLGFFFDWLIVDVLPHAPTVWCPLNVQICDPRRPTTLVSGGPGGDAGSSCACRARTSTNLNRADDRVAPARAVGRDAGERAASSGTPSIASRRAGSTRGGSGRLLLAGDAAHQMPPFAGQGMCSGLRDAANLAWKLDLVLAGRAPADLLDTLSQRAHPARRRGDRLLDGARQGDLHRRPGRGRALATR